MPFPDRGEGIGTSQRFALNACDVNGCCSLFINHLCHDSCINIYDTDISLNKSFIFLGDDGEMYLGRNDLIFSLDNITTGAGMQVIRQNNLYQAKEYTHIFILDGHGNQFASKFL